MKTPQAGVYQLRLIFATTIKPRGIPAIPQKATFQEEFTGCGLTSPTGESVELVQFEIR
jgi:hypothetical protein